MKNFSLGLNVVLLVAVIFLYVKVFSGDKKADPKTVHTAGPVSSSSMTGRAPIAYVELDSLNDKIDYLRTRRTELEGEQRAIETEWQTGLRGLDSRKNEFLKKGNAITQQEAEQFQNEYYAAQQQIDAKKQQLTGKLTEKSYKFMEDIQKKLKDFLAEYNKEKNYQYILTVGTGQDYMLYKDSSYNITNDVISGMNEQLNKK